MRIYSAPRRTGSAYPTAAFLLKHGKPRRFRHRLRECRAVIPHSGQMSIGASPLGQKAWKTAVIIRAMPHGVKESGLILVHSNPFLSGISISFHIVPHRLMQGAGSQSADVSCGSVSGDQIAQSFFWFPLVIQVLLEGTGDPLRMKMKAVPFPVDLQDWERFIFVMQFSVVTGVRDTWTRRNL